MSGPIATLRSVKPGQISDAKKLARIRAVIDHPGVFHWAGQDVARIYQLTDRLHGRTVRVQADHIAATVASWLAELDARSPVVESLGRAVRDGDWPAIHAIADYLSVEVQVAA